MLKKLLICVAVVIALAVVAITLGVTLSNRPEVVIKKSIANTMEDFMDREEFSAIFKTLAGGSVTVDVEGDLGKVQGKLYFSDVLSPDKAQLYAEDVKLKNGEGYIYFSTYLSSDYAYIADASFLDGSYGVSRGDAEEAYLVSPLAPGADSLAFLDEDDHAFLRALLRMYDAETDLAMIKDAEKTLKRYEGKLTKIFLEHAEIEEENRKVRVCGTRMESRVITVSVDEQALADMVTDLYDTLAEDKKLRDLVVKYNQTISDLMGNGFDALSYYDETFLNADTWTELYNRITDQKFEISVVLVTALSSAVLRQLSVNVTTDEEREVLFLDIGKNGVKNADYVTLDVYDTRYIYEVAENDNRLFEAYVYMEKDVLLALEIDKKGERYSLTVSEDTEYVGKYLEEGDTITVSLDKIRQGEHTELCDLKVILDTKDKMPTPQKREDMANLFTLSKEDWRTIADWFGYQGLAGTYSNVVDWFGVSLEFDIFGGLTMTTYGNSGEIIQTVIATYEINGDVISIYTPSDEGDGTKTQRNDYPLVIDKDYIEINGVVYQREG